MRSEQEMLDLILATARADERIRAVILNGSRANPNAPKDIFQDFDAYGGRYLARGGKLDVLEGDWNPSRIVVLEFPTAEQAKAWIDSPEYREARALRHATATTHAILVEGM